MFSGHRFPIRAARLPSGIAGAGIIIGKIGP